MNAAFPCRACTWLDVQKDERKIRLISCKLNYNFVSNQKFRTSTQTAHRNAVGTPTYRCTASYSHLSNRRSPLNGRTEIYSQRIKPPQVNRPVHRYPVPGFQRVVKRLWSRFFCNFSLAKQRKVFQNAFTLLGIVFASARPVSAC